MKNIVVIGAGPAGLSCAYKLLKNKKKFNVTILESSNKVGGISRTEIYKNNRIDIGGHRFFTKDEEVMKFWMETMPIQGKMSKDDKLLNNIKKLADNDIDPEKTNDVFLIRRRLSRIYYSHNFFDYPVSFSWNTIKNLGFITTIICGFSYIKSMIFKRKENNLEDFYINRFGKKLYSLFFESYTEKVWGRHPKYISALWGSQRVKGISIKELIKNKFSKNKSNETSLIEQFYYPKYGPGSFYENVLKKIEQMGGKIIYNSEVKEIVINDNNVEYIEYEKNSKMIKLKVDKLISSMPLDDLMKAMNSVPKNILNISNKLPFRDFITVGLLVKKLEINNNTNIKTINNIVPDTWIYVQEPNIKMGRIQIFNNWSPYMVKEDNKVWIGLEYFCDSKDDFWNQTDKMIESFARNELCKMNIVNDKNIVDSCVIRSRKAYPAYFDSYDKIDIVKKYLYKISNLYCIGRNGQHHYNNMDHSIKTGMIAAKQIINNRKDDLELWNVNVEKEYHEVKK